MRHSRRDFIRYVGVMLASLVARGCRPTCYAPAVTPPPNPSAPPPNPEWAALRECWLELGNPSLQSPADDDYSRKLRRRHAAALEALVAAGELDAAVAEDITVAFEEAMAHIKRQLATCYIALPPEFVPREDLMHQAALLEEMAAKGAIDPSTVALAQAALERDVAWLAQFHAGQRPGELGELEVDPTSAEAARILVDLLVGAYE